MKARGHPPVNEARPTTGGPRGWGKFLGILMLPAVWELLSRSGLVNPFFIPPFSQVAVAAWELAASGMLTVHGLLSLERSLAGLAIAVILGVPLGLLLADWFKRLELIVNPVLEFLAQINPFIMFHLILCFVPLGEMVQITIIAWACVWPVLYNTSAGVQTINPALIKAGRSFGLNYPALFWKVIVPAAAPAIFAGIRLGAGYSVFMLIAAEMMGSTSGLGWLVASSQANYEVARIFAAALIIALLGLGLDLALQFAGRRFAVAEDEDSQLLRIGWLD